MAKKSISLRVDEEKIKRLDDIAYSQDRSRSYIIEKAIEEYVHSEEYWAARLEESRKQIDRGEYKTHGEMKDVFADYKARIKAKIASQT